MGNRGRLKLGEMQEVQLEETKSFVLRVIALNYFEKANECQLLEGASRLARVHTVAAVLWAQQEEQENPCNKYVDWVSQTQGRKHGVRAVHLMPERLLVADAVDDIDTGRAVVGETSDVESKKRIYAWRINV